jgi:pyruvate/2-oxoglutarate/acetoin dehydrogenase E1 component
MANDLGKAVDFATDGKYADRDEVKVVLTRAQLALLADAVGMLNSAIFDDEPAAFLEDFAADARRALRR